MVITTKTVSKKNRVWLRKIEHARQNLQREMKDWRRNRALLLGIPPTGVTDWASVNLAWAAFETMVGICYQKNSEVIVRETNPQSANAAKILTTATFEDFDLMRVRYHARLAILDTFWAGRGIIIEKMLGDVTTSTYRWIEGGKEHSANYPDIRNKRTALGRVHPYSFIQDTTAVMGDLTDAAWTGVEFYPTVKEVKESKQFKIDEEILKNLPKLRTAPSLEMPFSQSGRQQPSSVMGAEDDRDDNAQIRMWEIWDRVNRVKLYIPAYTDQVVDEGEWPLPLYFNGTLRYPFTPLFFNEHPDKAFPIPEISTAAPQLEQFQILFRTMVRDAITRWRKFLVQGDLLQKGHIGRITTGPAHTVVSLNPQKIGDPTKIDLAKVIMPIPDTPIKADVMGAMSTVKELVHEIFGAGDFASGGLRTTRSATEAAALSDFLKVRMTNRTENIDSFFKELSTNHVLLLQQILDEKRVIQITGPDGIQQFQQFDKDVIKGEFTFHVIAGSSQSRNTEVARQEALAWYQQTLPIISQSGGDIRPIIEWIAPFYRIPNHIVESVFSGHKQALQQLALIMAAVHMGARVPGEQLIEAISQAVNSGLSQADIGAVMQQAQSAQKAQSAQAAPGGLPGANGAPGTSGAPGPPGGG